MIVEVDPGGRKPVFEQIRGQLAAKIAGEELPAGTKLPTIRELAKELGLAANTVARAYRELEKAGLITTRPRHGTVVAKGHSLQPGAGVRERIREAARDYAALAHRLGMSPADAHAIVTAELASLGEPAETPLDNEVETDGA